MLKEKTVIFTITTSKDAYKADKVVVATGFYGQANMMNIPGEELPKVSHYYNEAHGYTWQKLMIIGGGNSAVDAALEAYRANAQVTMVVKYDTIKPTVKYWVKPDIENRIKKGNVEAYFNTQVKEIREGEVVLATPYGEKVVENDFVLAMTGYHPNFDLMEKLGIDITEDEKCIPVHNNNSLETNRKGMYVAGVVCAGMETTKLFIENTRVHAEQIASDIAEKLK